MSNQTTPNYIIPALAPLYSALRPVSGLLLRVMAGVAFMAHGWPKIQAPMGAVGMVESIGFYPGVFWSPALSIVEFFGGLLLILGFLTRPVAAALSVVLMVTTYFHWIHLGQGYSGAELSLIWLTVTFYFFVNGAGRASVDGMIGRQF